MENLADNRPAASSGAAGPDSPRDREVDLEIAMGSLGCGDLIYELREQVSRVEAGEVVRLVSDDPGARAEIPAWCRMTGHELLSADHPYYIIKVRAR